MQGKPLADSRMTSRRCAFDLILPLYFSRPAVVHERGGQSLNFRTSFSSSKPWRERDGEQRYSLPVSTWRTGEDFLSSCQGDPSRQRIWCHLRWGALGNPDVDARKF